MSVFAEDDLLIMTSEAAEAYAIKITMCVCMWLQGSTALAFQHLFFLYIQI